jgi:hypothetical protein
MRERKPVVGQRKGLQPCPLSDARLKAEVEPIAGALGGWGRSVHPGLRCRIEMKLVCAAS